MYDNSKIIQGLMRTKDLSVEELYELIKFDIDNGITFFDVADIYNDGDSERKIGEVIKLHPEIREKMFLQTKVGIVKDRENDVTLYDLSYEHIIDAVNKSLERLNVSYVDSLLLHRPDIFLDAKEIARAFSTLLEERKVKHFGVSNFPHEVIKFLTDQTNIPIEINQLQLGLGHLDLVREVLNCNVSNVEGTEHTGELFFYMKRYGIKLQCWSPYQYGFFNGSIFEVEEMKEANKYMEELAKKYGTNKCAIATAFILMLGENIQVVTGSTNKKHVLDAIDGTKVKLTKAEWYTLYRKTGNLLP